MTPAALTAKFEAARDLLRQNRPAEALAVLDAILAQVPAYLPARVTRGQVLLVLGRPDEAEAAWRAALKASPFQEVVVWNLGALLMERERPEEAMALAQEVIANRPQQPRARLLLADALSRLGRFEEAIESYQLVPRTDEVLVDLLTKEAMALAALQRHDEAMVRLDAAIAHKPDDTFATFRRAMVRLSRHDFGGWGDYEARWRLPSFVERSGAIITNHIARQLTLSPTREQLAGQRVLLLGEQGIGDQVMFASMVADLREVAASITLVCDPRLVALFGASLPGVRVASPHDGDIRVGDIDKVVAMGSLGHMFRPTPASFPRTPYLAPRAQTRADWAARLGPRNQSLRIGLTWRGGTAATRSSFRSLSLERLQPLLQIPGCEFVSLQHGDVAAEVAASPVPVRTFPADDLRDFDDLGALIAELDLVISVQTSVVHLCGAIGQTCLTLIPHNPEWRYGAAGSTMAWYDSVRLYRQAETGDWDPVIDQIGRAVRERLASAS